MMKIGVIFCGGCQSHYNRSDAYQTILSNIPFNFEYAKENVSYDHLLVINGCKVACASTTYYIPKNTIVLRELKDLDLVIDKLKTSITNSLKKPI